MICNKLRTKQLFVCVVFLLVCGIQATYSQATILGDVNNSGVVDIVDALLVARYYVGLNPSNFSAGVADVNGSGAIKS